MKLGKLTQAVITKDFPEKWTSLAPFLGAKSSVTEDGNTVQIEFDNGMDILISKEGEISTYTPLTQETIYQIITEIASKNRK